MSSTFQEQPLPRFHQRVPAQVVATWALDSSGCLNTTDVSKYWMICLICTAYSSLTVGWPWIGRSSPNLPVLDASSTAQVMNSSIPCPSVSHLLVWKTNSCTFLKLHLLSQFKWFELKDSLKETTHPRPLSRGEEVWAPIDSRNRFYFAY